MNNKIFSNLDTDPRKLLKLTEIKSTLWAETPIARTQRAAPNVEATNLPIILGRWCFTDRSWKGKEFFSGQA